MSLKYAQLYKEEPKEEYFTSYRIALGGRVANMAPTHPFVKHEREIFLQKVKALDMDVKHLVFEEDWSKAYDEYDNCLGRYGYPIFMEKIKSYEDPADRDADAKKACEDDDFEAFLKANQKLWIQALTTKHATKLKLRDEQFEKFQDWKTCPWKGDVYDYAIYLLKYPKGPSGRDNTKIAEAFMKCFYAGIDISKDEEKMKALADPKIELKPRPEMIQDLKDAQVPLEKQREIYKQKLEEIEKKIAQRKMEGLKEQFENLVSKLKRKKSFNDVQWDFKELPKTKKARVFMTTVNNTIKEVKDLEKMAKQAREEATITLGIAIEELFNS